MVDLTRKVHHLSRKELELAARKAYQMSTPAFAFVYALNNDEGGLRLEAPDLMRVFSDNAQFGRGWFCRQVRHLKSEG